MRSFLSLIFFTLLLSSCIKKPLMSKEPELEFKDFKFFQKANGSDSAYIVLGYRDGDGDIFRDENNSVPNLVITTWHLDPATNTFVQDFVEPAPGEPKVPVSYATTIYQPGEGYKGKAIKGEILVPYNEFRSSNDVKTIYHSVYAIDEAGNKSNVVTSPTITLNF